MSQSSYLYVNPIGDVVDISYNDIGNYMKNKNTRDAQVEDAEKKNKSNNVQLALWTFTAAICLLILLALIRNIND